MTTITPQPPTPAARLRDRLRLHLARLRGLAYMTTPAGLAALQADPLLLLDDFSALLHVLADDSAQIVLLADEIDARGETEQDNGLLRGTDI